MLFLLLVVAVLAGGGTVRGQESVAEPMIEENPLIPESLLVPGAPNMVESRLRALFQQLPELREVEVEFRDGVVTLSGAVLSATARERAEDLALQLELVRAVNNEIRESRSVRERLRPVVEKLENRLLDLLAALPLLLVAALLVLAALWLGRRVGRWERPFRRISANPFLRQLLQQVAQAAVVLVGVLVALELLGATAIVGALLGTAGIVGLAVGFAFRDLVENYIASILLSVRQPFGPGDLVDVDGRQGKVIRLTSRATILRTLDGNHLRIPNSQVFKGVVLNYDRNPHRRFHFEVGIAPEQDLAEALRVGVEALEEMPGVLSKPPPAAYLSRVGDSTLTATFYAWVDQAEHGFAKVNSEAIRQVVQALQAAGVEMPEPTYRVRTGPLEATEAPAAEFEGPPADLSVDRHLDREVAAERRDSGEVDLLDPRAPQE